jgi:hypothetical protein
MARRKAFHLEDTPGSRHYEHHLTYSEYLEQALYGEPRGGSKSMGARRSRETGDSGWAGTNTWEEAAKLATEGWPEGREFIGKIVDQIDNVTAKFVTLPAPYNDVSGDYVDVGAYLEGIPENMVRWEEQESPKRVVRILYTAGCSGSVSKEAIRWKGATTLALIDRLEAQGIRVELDVAWSDGDDIKGNEKSIWTTYVTFKSASDALHLDTLAFHLANAASMRRIQFSYRETLSKEEVNKFGFHSSGGYGYSRRATGEGYDLIIPELYLATVEDSVREIEKMFDVICGEKLTVD